MVSIDEIDDATAQCLLKKALLILSKKCEIDLSLECFSNGEVCIVTGDREVILFILEDHTKYGKMYFDSAFSLLKALLDSRTYFTTNLQTKLSHVKFSDIFGTSIDELRIKIDLLS